MDRRSIVPGIAIAACIAFSPSENLDAHESGQPNVRALLVGCTDYNHPGIPDLAGPANDVQLFRDLLTGPKFRVADNHHTIMELVGAAATRENITSRIQHLADTAREGEHIVILLAGHGARQQDDGDDEVDGLDEVFCPVDINYDDEIGSIDSGGITDDEIGQWLSQMTSKGARVWLIADSCHNGTLTRGEVGSSDQIARGLGSSTMSRGPGGGLSREVHDRPMEGVVAFYAAPPAMKTFEKKIDGKAYGIFSRTLCSVIRNSNERLTYRRLLQKVQAEYDRNGWRSPTPQLESDSTESGDTILLGDTQLKGSDLRVVAQTDDGYLLNAGQLRGVTPGTILGVYGSAEDKKPTGFVQVTESSATRSTVRPLAFQGLQWKDDQSVPLDGFCVIARSGMELKRLTVAVGQYSQNTVARPDRQPLTADVRDYWTQVLRESLTGNEQQAQLVEVVDSPANADWVLRPATPNSRHVVYLFPKDGFEQQAAEESVLMSPAGEEQVKTWLSTRLPDIARSCNLIGIAAAENGEADDQLPLVVELRRVRDKHDNTGRPFEPASDPTLQPDCTLASGEKVGVFIRNPNPFAVNATVLFIDGQLHTTACFPQQGLTGNQLAPAGKTGDRVMATKLGIDDETPGVERVVTIATRAVPGEPHDFTFLASATERDATTRSGGGPGSSGFEKLLSTAVTHPTGTRSGPLADPQYSQLEDHAINVISWTTIPDADQDRGLLSGGAENLKARVVVEEGTKYQTNHRSQAVLGSYGRLIPGNKLLFRPDGFYPQGMVDDIDRIERWKPFLHKTGTTTLQGLLKFTVPTERWQVSGMAGGNSSSQVTYEMKGQRLVAEDVERRLQKNPSAMSYFRRVRQQEGVPIVITQNIVMSKCKIGRHVAWNADAKLHLAGLSENPSISTNGESRNDQDNKEPLVRCYLMHEVILENDGSVALEPFPRPRF